MIEPVEVWRYQGGGNLSSDFVYGVATAAGNSVFLLGTQDDYDTTGSDFAVIKIDSDGDLLWEWKNGSLGNDALCSAAAVGDGIVGSGYVNGAWNGVSSVGGADFAVIKLYSNGSFAWSWTGGTAEDEFLYATSTAVDGNVVAAGNTQGSWADTNDGWNDVAAVKLRADNGEVIWEYQNGTTEYAGAYVRSAAARGDGSVVLGGFTYGSFAKDFEGESGATDFLAVALDENGTELWRWQGGSGTGINVVYGVAAFDDGSVLLAGVTEGSWAIANLGEGDFAVAKLNASGHLEWSWQEGTESEDEFESAAIGIDESVVLSGHTYGSWAATQAGSESDRDFVAMSINADGEVLWRYQAGSTWHDNFNDVAVRPDGGIILGGSTNGIWATSATSLTSDFAAVLLNTTTSTTSPTPSPITFPTSIPPEGLTSVDVWILASAILVVCVLLGIAFLVYRRSCMSNPSEKHLPALKLGDNNAEVENSRGDAFRKGGSCLIVCPDNNPSVTSSSALTGILHATREAARTAQSSSVTLVPEVAILVEKLVGLVEDSRVNDEVFRKTKELFGCLKLMLEEADRVLRFSTNAEVANGLLQSVKNSVEGLVGITTAYQASGRLSKVFTATMYSKRYDDANEAVHKMLQYFQTHLAVRMIHDQQESKQEMKNFHQDILRAIESHKPRPEADSVYKRRAKLLNAMEISGKDIKITEHVLGKGVTGKVYFADCYGFNAAAKVMKLEETSNSGKQRNVFLNELEHMRRLRSPCTVEVYGVVTSRRDELVLVMEYMSGGDLFAYIRKHRETKEKIPEKVARRLIEDVANGLNFLHSKDTWHGDLKSLNVLLDASDRAKISDFGTSHWTEQTKSKTVRSNWVRRGEAWFDALTFHWAAPEVLDASEEQHRVQQETQAPAMGLSFKSDIYSFAIIAWEVLALKVPWNNLSGQEIFRRVCMRQDRPEIPTAAAGDLAEMIRQCWHNSPEKRLTSEEIVNHLRHAKRPGCAEV